MSSIRTFSGLLKRAPDTDKFSHPRDARSFGLSFEMAPRCSFKVNSERCLLDTTLDQDMTRNFGNPIC